MDCLAISYYDATSCAAVVAQDKARHTSRLVASPMTSQGEPYLAGAYRQGGGAVLSGTLLDGGGFSFDLNASNPAGNPLADVFYGTAVVTVTRTSGGQLPPGPDDDRIFSSRFQQLPEPMLSQM